jgi:hypothetical protein
MQSDDALMNAAMAEAYASCPLEEAVILHTLEFVHPTFVDAAGADTPVRIVRWPVTGNDIQTFSLKLEDEAPKNPGEYVDFIHAPFEVTIPAQEEHAPGEFKIRVEHVGHLLSASLLSAVRQRDPICMIFREYLKSMPEAPQIIYTDFMLSAVTVSNNAVEGTATMIDWLTRIYGRIYTPSEFPGLVRGR